jgi:hypothetical protein
MPPRSDAPGAMSVTEEKLTTREALEQTATAGLVAVFEVAKQVPGFGTTPEAQALLAVALPAFGLALGRHLYHAYVERVPRLTRGFGKAFDQDPVRVADHAKTHESDADYHETMYRAFRTMLDAVDPEVVETVGYLAGKYTADGRKPDAFFRSLGQLLCELEPGQLPQLKSILGYVLSAQEKLEHVGGVDLVVEYQDDLTTRVDIVLGHSRFLEVGIVPSATRLVHLLKRFGLAGAATPGIPELAERLDDDTAGILFEQASQMMHVLDPENAHAMKLESTEIAAG